jgi:hypothetical protein
MLKAGTILNRLYERLEPAAKNRKIADLRVGLSYVGVKLDDGAAGIAALLQDSSPQSCTVLKEAGTYAGACAADVLKSLVDGKSALHRGIGLAAANALVGSPAGSTEDREATTYFNLQSGEKVVMVGLFTPLIDRIRKTGAELIVIEKNPDRLEPLSVTDRNQALQDCDVAIITATTLINNTFLQTVSQLGSPRLVAVLGPSTPLVPEIFRDTPVTHLGGAVVADAPCVLQIISEGGGTPALRQYLRFVNLTF